MKDVFYGDKTKNVRGNRATELLEHISALFTKEDVIAMLTDIQLEIEELDPMGNEWSDSLDACSELIQQKINALGDKTDAFYEK